MLPLPGSTVHEDNAKHGHTQIERAASGSNQPVALAEETESAHRASERVAAQDAGCAVFLVSETRLEGRALSQWTPWLVEGPLREAESGDWPWS
jgi:hypothetical protein